MRYGAPVIRVVRSGEFDGYRRRMVETGQRADGQFKVLRLISDTSFAAEFQPERDLIGSDRPQPDPAFRRAAWSRRFGHAAPMSRPTRRTNGWYARQARNPRRRRPPQTTSPQEGTADRRDSLPPSTPRWSFLLSPPDCIRLQAADPTAGSDP